MTFENVIITNFFVPETSKINMEAFYVFFHVKKYVTSLQPRMPATHINRPTYHHIIIHNPSLPSYHSHA